MVESVRMFLQLVHRTVVLVYWLTSANVGASPFRPWSQGASARPMHAQLLDHSKGTRNSFLIIATSSKVSYLWDADVSHKHVNLGTDTKWVMAHVMEMQLITVPAHSVFIGHVICIMMVRISPVLSLSVFICTSYLMKIGYYMRFHFLTGGVEARFLIHLGPFLLSSMLLWCRKCKKLLRQVLKKLQGGACGDLNSEKARNKVQYEMGTSS